MNNENILQDEQCWISTAKRGTDLKIENIIKMEALMFIKHFFNFIPLKVIFQHWKNHQITKIQTQKHGERYTSHYIFVN